jgi:UDP-glucose 4-epimerase
MRILLTGATGYIGSHLMGYMGKRAGHELVPMCRKLPAHFESWRNDFQVIEADITDINGLKGKVPDPFDCIVHMASFNDVNTSKYPDQALMVNGIGTRNILELARHIKCPRIIYFSTLQVYGKELAGNYTHETPTHCEDDYALTHFIAEEYCRMFSRRHGLNVSVLRPANIFGCPVHHLVNRWTLIPTTLCLSAYREGRIVLKSSGKQNRDFVSLEFVSESAAHLIDSPPSGFNIYNVTSEQLFSVKEIAQMVAASSKQVLNKDVEIICESEHPKEANIFSVKNNITVPHTKIIIREELSVEICKIFEMLKVNGG